jgi:tryptophanyl-tRNA synthetase
MSDTTPSLASPLPAQGKQRALSGIKPTGIPHLGNHLGMIAEAIAMQDAYETFYFIADYHALTSLHDADKMRLHTQQIASYFLAFGLDPARATFFRQSDVPEVCELTWLLSCITSMGHLERAHAWKAAKDLGNEGEQPHGLFAYPVLMAADILLYDAHVVPVGKDQVQHIEMTRDMAQRFNHVFGDSLRVPSAKVRADVQTIPGLDGRKMSKSYDNTFSLVEKPKALRQKVMKIVTDSTPMEDPKDPETCNVFSLYKLFATAEEQAELAARYRAGNFGYGHAKQALYEALERVAVGPRERFDSLMQRPDDLEDILLTGAARARESARAVLARVRERVGLRPKTW